MSAPFPSQGHWYLVFPLDVVDRVLNPIPLMKPCDVSKRERFIGLIGGLTLCVGTVKPDELAGRGLNLSCLHSAV